MAKCRLNNKPNINKAVQTNLQFKLLSVIGIIIALYYIIKVIIQSIIIFRKTPGGSIVRSFVKIHFPMIISIIVLLLMISTFIGAAHFEHGVLSIEPNSRNLIIYADDSPRDNSISVRGPYTIDSAIENESDMIRVPSDAMMTLGIKYNDTIEIDGETYSINETRPGEPDILRLPIHAKKDLNVRDEDVIQNSRLKEIFAGSKITHNYDNDNVSIDETFIVSSRDRNAMSFEVFINNESVVSSAGVLKSDSIYDITIDGEHITSITDLNNTSFEYKNNTVRIVFKDTNSTAIKQYVPENQGIFLNFNFKEDSTEDQKKEI